MNEITIPYHCVCRDTDIMKNSEELNGYHTGNYPKEMLKLIKLISKHRVKVMMTKVHSDNQSFNNN